MDIADRIEIWSKLHNVDEKNDTDVSQNDICLTDFKTLEETINVSHIDKNNKKKVSNNKNFEVKSDVYIDDVINVFEFNVTDLKRESDILDDLHDSLVDEKEDKKIIPQQEHKVRRKKKISIQT